MKRWKGGQNSLFKIAFLFSWLMMLKRGGVRMLYQHSREAIFRSVDDA